MSSFSQFNLPAGVHHYDSVTVEPLGSLNVNGDATLVVTGNVSVLTGSTPEGTLPGLVNLTGGINGTNGSRGTDGADGDDGMSSAAPDAGGGEPGTDGGEGTDAVDGASKLTIQAGGTIFLDGTINGSPPAGGSGADGGEGGYGGDGFSPGSGDNFSRGGHGASGGTSGSGGDAGNPGQPFTITLSAGESIIVGTNSSFFLRGTRGSAGGDSDQGGDGGWGGDGKLFVASSGGDGGTGGAGGHGGDASGGTRGADLIFMAPLIDVRGGTIDLSGGDGGSGGSGGEGGDGGPGGHAGVSDITLISGAGGNGGAAGQAGVGGAGGNAGRGGNIHLLGHSITFTPDFLYQFGGGAGSGGSGGFGGTGGRGGSGEPPGMDAGDTANGTAGADGQAASNGQVFTDFISESLRNGSFEQGMAFFNQSGGGSASVVETNGNSVLEMTVDTDDVSVTQLTTTEGASALELVLDYRFLTPGGTLEVLLDSTALLDASPAGVSSSFGSPALTTNAFGHHVRFVITDPGMLELQLADLTLRLLPGSTATVQVDNLSFGPPLLRLLPPVIVGPDVVVSFLGLPGDTYRCEYTAQLGGTNWTTLADNLSGAQAAVAITNSGAAAEHQRFYRVVQPGPPQF